MSIYESIPMKTIALKRPFRVFSDVFNTFISGPKTGKPFKLKFESSTLCNLKCVMCPLTSGISRKKGVLKFENFKKVFDEVKVPYLNLTGLGEPLLNKDIFKIIEYARRNGSLVKLDTNATLLDEENIRRLIKSGPSIISVSIDGINKKSYERIRKGSNFEKVIGNLKKLIGYKKAVGSKTQIHLFFVFQKENIHELIDFIKFGDALGVDAINGTIVISFGEAKNELNRKIDITKLKRLGEELSIIKKSIRTKLNIEIIEDFLKKGESIEESVSHKPCYYPWYNPSITWDGYVVPCDIHCNNEIVFGNAFEEPFMKIWNSKKAQAFRKQLVKERKGLCAKCCVDETFIFDRLRFIHRIPIVNKLSYRRIK